jgi:rubrerythrin
MTVGNLQSAFSGESQAHMRYANFAERAEGDGYPNVARLFRAISWAELVHASNHFRVLRNEKGGTITVAHAGFGLGPSADNLQAAIDGEEFEVNEMYPAYIAVATQQEEKAAERSFDWAHQAEKTHSALFQMAKSAVESGEDYDIGPVQVCSVCGHTMVGDAPDRCPICNATGDKYRAFA